uniref:Uncharacterized protein n=2 Tax=Palpitomonas bilix TaxID=652834 RepID=A0A7S3GBR2_9EUKA|mmetsp:Transcript_37845/g.97665  ORF Transcript_37845/g.97665 Transcript_37845/m.97665 type:complete len:186 (+) Transcript_37845:214-771(+)
MDHPATTVEQVGETAGEVLIRREKVVVEGSTAINAERWARFRSFRPDLWTMDRPKRELSKKAIHVVDEKDPTDDSLPLRRGTCARFRPDGGGIVSVGEDGRLLSYELRKGGARLTATATLQAEVVYSDMGDSYLQRKPRTVALEINHCAFAPNKSMRATRIPVAIATGKYDNALRIVELRRDIIT